MNLKKYYSIFLLIAFVIVVQLFATLSGQEYYLTQLIMAGYYSLVVIGLTVLMGYTGQISLGHAAFFAMGGYITAVFTTKNLLLMKGNAIAGFILKFGLYSKMIDPYGKEIVYLSPWLSLFIAMLVTVVIAFLIGIPILKLKGHYLAMATLGFGIIIYRVLLGTKIFGEADGISEVPPFNLFFNISVNGDSSVRIENYYIAWFIVIMCLFFLLNLINSRTGRALRSIHGSEDAANAMGVNTSRYKLYIFVLSAVFASLGGVMLTHFNGGIGPSEAGVMKSVRYVAIVAIGGMANLWGALITGVILNYLSLMGYFGSYDDTFFGVMLVAIMLFSPNGLFTKENFKKLRLKLPAKKNSEIDS